MALWVLHERCCELHNDPDVAAAFRADVFVQGIRAKNLVEPLIALSQARLAGALESALPTIAAIVACQRLDSGRRNDLFHNDLLMRRDEVSKLVEAVLKFDDDLDSLWGRP